MAIAQDMDGNYRAFYREISSDGDESDSPTFSLAEELYALVAEDQEILEIGKKGNLIRQCPLFSITDSKAGTGKTMAAQVMAKEIGMALYRVDLSQLEV